MRTGDAAREAVCAEASPDASEVAEVTAVQQRNGHFSTGARKPAPPLSVEEDALQWCAPPRRQHACASGVCMANKTGATAQHSSDNSASFATIRRISERVPNHVLWHISGKYRIGTAGLSPPHLYSERWHVNLGSALVSDAYREWTPAADLPCTEVYHRERI